MELDYYQQKLNVPVAVRVAKRHKTQDIKFQENLKIVRRHSLVPMFHSKNKNLAIA